jgi:hypothetical protein
MGSRDSQTIVYWDCDIIQVKCGCFSGNLLEFEEAVKNHYKENDENRIRYLNFIHLVWNLIES